MIVVGTAWVWLVGYGMGVVVGFMGHCVGCECDGLLFAGLFFCGFACSVLEKREANRKRERKR